MGWRGCPTFGVQFILSKGIHIQSIIANGFKELAQLFPDIPLSTVLASPTTNHSSLLRSSEQRFKQLLENWLKEHENFLNEKTVNPETGHSFYTHKRLRSAFLSLKRNLLEDYFGDVKRLLSCHSGMKKENKIRFIKDYFSEK